MVTVGNTILIGDNGSTYTATNLRTLRDMGFHVITTPRNGQVIWETIQKEQPDVVVMDATVPQLDAVSLMEKLQDAPDKPIFIITSSYENEFIEKQVMTSGASYFMCRPFAISMLGDRIQMLLATKTKSNQTASAPEDDEEKAVTELIRRLGIPAHIRGYHYLRTAILCAIPDQSLLHSMTKRLYPAVAEKHATTSPRVERAIRHAIHVAWDRGDEELLDTIFGYTMGNYKGCPTNAEFIAMLTDRLALKYREKEVV